jgi:archaemetzincin
MRYALCAMRKSLFYVCSLYIACIIAQSGKVSDKYSLMIEKLRPLHEKLGRIEPGDWLFYHNEPGQTFREYLSSKPVTPQGKRNIIYIQPLGKFTPAQRRVVDLTADFIGLFYSCPVKIQKSLPLSSIPSHAKRIHPSWEVRQILSTYLLDSLLKPSLPKDAAACLAFTASDLWPGEGWNFVFGQASLDDRVGVWSIHRNGNPEKSGKSFRLCLLRTMKTGVHEAGHMFSIRHCVHYECGMCGSNHREEADRRPLWFCPECATKVYWATKADPVERYRKLSDFCKKQLLLKEADFYRKSAKALSAEK